MAFSMDQVKVCKRKSRNIKSYFAIVYGLRNIDDETKQIILTYLRCRIKMYGFPRVTELKWEMQLKDLISYCCGIDYVEVTPVIMHNNKLEMLYNLKYVLNTPNPKKLYREKDKDIDLYKFVDDNIPTKLNLTKGLSEAELMKYFEG